MEKLPVDLFDPSARDDECRAWLDELPHGYLLHFGDVRHGLLFRGKREARQAAFDWARWARPAKLELVGADGHVEEVKFDPTEDSPDAEGPHQRGQEEWLVRPSVGKRR